MIKYVTKRDGSQEEFNVGKIKQAVQFACEGLDVNPLELEARVNIILKNGIKTSTIMQNVIESAIQLASPETPQWVFVAGRAFSMNEYHNWQSKGKTFSKMLKEGIKKGVYASDYSTYTEEEVEKFESIIDYTRDLSMSISAHRTAKDKYLLPGEVNQHLHMLNAMRFGLATRSQPTELALSVKEAYDSLSNREFSLATPWMGSWRTGGNVASCFIIAPDDNLESIMSVMTRAAYISKAGGGVGVYLGYLRASGSKVKGRENSAGSIVNWVKILNDIGVAVDQGGKRAGAIKVSLPLWHNDIDKFLDMQEESGDPRSRAFDVFPNIIVNDIFQERQLNKEQWITFCPFEVKEVLGISVRGLHGEDFKNAYLQIEEAVEAGKLKVFQIYPNARDLLKKAIKMWVSTGLPDVTFTDRINEWNPNKGDPQADGIIAVNLCTESYSPVVPDKYDHVCNLGSIVMGSIRDFDHLAQVTRTAVRMLNAGIEIADTPTEFTKAHNKRYRTIGIGIMGLHDYLAKNWKNYSSLDDIEEVAEIVQYNAVCESARLAQVYGSFGAFEHSEWKNGNMIKRYKSQSKSKHVNWDEAQRLIDLYGMCNSQLTSPAPTTTTSLYQDSSASHTPIYSAYYMDDNKSGKNPVVGRFLAQNPLCYAKTQVRHSQIEIIDSTARVQKWTDTGVSMELVFNVDEPGFSAKSMYDAFNHAYNSNLKTIYYIRSKKIEIEACVGCAG